jgi:ParB family chromosome partitioning protein
MKRRTFIPDMPLPAYRDRKAGDPILAGEAPLQHPDSETPALLESVGGRHLKHIPITLIDANPLAPREVYTPQMIQGRADDLRSQGQHDPIHVIPNPEAQGRFVIADGWTRVQACRDHKVMESLLAEVHYDLTVQEAAWFGYQQNECRQQHCDLDRAMFYERLIATGETASEVARQAKVSRQQMSMYRSYGKLPPDVMDVIRSAPEKFTYPVVNELRKLFEQCGTRKAVVLAAKFAAADQTVRWLIAQVQAGLNPSAHKSTPPVKLVRYGNGAYKQRGNLFEVSIEVSDELRVEFAAALEALLDTVAVQAPLELSVVPEADQHE